MGKELGMRGLGIVAKFGEEHCGTVQSLGPPYKMELKSPLPGTGTKIYRELAE